MELLWVEFVEYNEEQAQFPLIFICQKIKMVILRIVGNLFNTSYIIEFVKIYFFLCINIEENAILGWTNHEGSLFIIH